MADGATPKPRLTGIEALRGIAALAVLLYHAARHVDAAYGAPMLMRVFQGGHAGVDLFFVLSGFLILHVHRGDIGRPERIGHYARQRFTRVMPLYWIALALTVLKGVGGHGVPAIGSLVHSALLLPGWEEPLLGPAWSLQHELLFYIVFAAFILNRRAGVALLGLWSAVMLIGVTGALDDAVPFQIAGHYNLEFLMGMGVALALPHIRKGSRMAWVGGLLLAAAAWLESAGHLDGNAAVARIAYGLPSALLIGGLATLSRTQSFALPRWLGALGGASYSIYLFQFLFMGLVVKGWAAAGLDQSAWAGLIFLPMVVAGIGGGLAVAHWVERPLLRQMRRGGATHFPRAALDAS